jgi:hypothetical protein
MNRRSSSARADHPDPHEIAELVGGSAHRAPIDPRIVEATTPCSRIRVATSPTSSPMPRISRNPGSCTCSPPIPARRYDGIDCGRGCCGSAGAVAKGASLTTATMNGGFASPSHFNDTFRELYGLTATALLDTGIGFVVFDG